MKHSTLKTFQEINGLIGNTPLIEILFKYKGTTRKVYSKLEYYNLTGSIKDRIACHMLYKAYEEHRLYKGMQLAEATSGNTGISFAAIGQILGNRTVIFMPDWMSSERIKLLKSYGADVRLVSREDGGFTGCILKCRELANSNSGIFLTSQFSNPYNTEAHFLSTGPEIASVMKKHSLMPDAVAAGVGTGGSVMGIGEYLRTINRHSAIYPIEPASSPTLSKGVKTGSHRIQGISDDFIPDLLKLNRISGILDVDDGDAIIIAQKLSSQLGLGVGISSGANFLGAILAQEKIDPHANVVTVFPDDNKKYLSTDLMREEPLKPGFLSPDVELISFRRL
jgi:cysteine synthase A